MSQANLPHTKILLGYLLKLSEELGQTAIEFGQLSSSLQGGYGAAWGRGGYPYVAELKRLARERKLKQTLDALRRSRYLKAQKIGQKLMLSLTDKAFTVSFAQQLRTTSAPRHGGYTIIIFDIPESQNNARRQLRWLLRQGGFIKLQQSVWGSRGDTYQLFKSFIKKHKLNSWVNIFYGNNFLSLPK